MLNGVVLGLRNYGIEFSVGVKLVILGRNENSNFVNA